MPRWPTSRARTHCTRARLRDSASHGLVHSPPGWDVIRKSPLRSTVLGKHYLELVRLAQNGETNKGVSDTLLFAFATPGDPDSRRLLVSWFLPSIVLFTDGFWSVPSSMAKLARLQGNQSVLDGTTLAGEAERELAAYRRMGRSIVGGVPPSESNE